MLHQVQVTPKSRERIADIYVPLGYSPVYANGSPRDKEQIKSLVDVLGDFDTVRFHVQRYGERCFKVNIHRKDALIGGERATISDTLTGFVGDDMLLRTSESFTIAEFFPDKCTVRLHFWANY